MPFRPFQILFRPTSDPILMHILVFSDQINAESDHGPQYYSSNVGICVSGKIETWPKSVQWLWSFTKSTWMFFIGLPSFFALLNLIVFGVGKNSALLNPILQPRASCKVISSEPEGKNFLSKLELSVMPPIYLLILPLKASMLYNATLSSSEGF